jgi:integrase
MGYVRKTPSGSWRACWRDANGRQPSKTFRTRREANAYLALIDTQAQAGRYVDPHAGRRVTFGVYATQWLGDRATELTTAARDRSYMRVHLMAEWADVPLSRIDHSSVQRWLVRLFERRAPATVEKCRQLMYGVMSAAVRDRLVASNPVEGVRLPSIRRKSGEHLTISMHDLTSRLLPAVPARYRALVALAGGTGLRWGECIGLRWDAIREDVGTLRVVRVAVEVSGHVTCKPYPKSRAGLRVVPVPPMVMQLLVVHREFYGCGPSDEVFTNEAGTPPRRTLFRARIWRPSLVRAGLLGQVSAGSGQLPWRATWTAAGGAVETTRHRTHTQAIMEVARKASGGLRFHDLRHSYASWLIASGVPITDAQKVMGHENPQTLLGIYSHVQDGSRDRILHALAAFSLPLDGSDTDTATDFPREMPLTRSVDRWA